MAMGIYFSFSVLLTVVQNFSSTSMTQIVCLLCSLVLYGYKLVAISLDTNGCSALFFTKKLHRIILIFARSRLQGCLCNKAKLLLEKVFYVTQSSFRWQSLVKSWLPTLFGCNSRMTSILCFWQKL